MGIWMIEPTSRYIHLVLVALCCLGCSVRFLTGHLRKGGGDPLQVVSSAAIDRDCTLVVYMGLASLPALTSRLLEAGLAPDTPAVLVERGTTPMQRTVRGGRE